MLALKRPEPRPSVLEIEPYVAGSNTTRRAATVFKLSSNETPLGPSPQAVCAYHEAAEHLAVYPDGSCAALRAAIGLAYNLNPALIVCGAGSDELLRLVAHAFLGPGEEAIHTVHGFFSSVAPSSVPAEGQWWCRNETIRPMSTRSLE